MILQASKWALAGKKSNILFYKLEVNLLTKYAPYRLLIHNVKKNLNHDPGSDPGGTQVNSGR